MREKATRVWTQSGWRQNGMGLVFGGTAPVALDFSIVLRRPIMIVREDIDILDGISLD